MSDAAKQGFADKLHVELVPVEGIMSDARALDYGAYGKGYGARSWERTAAAGDFAWSVAFGALLRHLFRWQLGEDVDPESGLSHLDHAGANLKFLQTFVARGIGDDDRALKQSGNSEHDAASAVKVPAETERDGAVVGALAAPASAPFSDRKRGVDCQGCGASAHKNHICVCPDPRPEVLDAASAGAIRAFSLLDPKADPPVNESAVADSEGDSVPLAVCSVGDTVCVQPPRGDREHTHGARAGWIGHVREITADYVLVDIPGVTRPVTPDGLWRFLRDEIEVLT